MKFLRLRDAEDELNYRPVSRLVGIGDTLADEIQLYFEPVSNTADRVDYWDLSVTNNNEKAVINAIVQAMNSGAANIITVADDHTSDYIHADLDAVVEMALDANANPS